MEDLRTYVQMVGTSIVTQCIAVLYKDPFCSSAEIAY